MNILFVAPYLPSRIRARPFNFIKQLRKKGHSIHFCGLDDSYSSAQDLEELQNLCETVEVFRLPRWRSLLNVFFGLFYGTALQTAYARSARLQKTVRARTNSRAFDILHLEHIRAGYCLPPERDIPALFDSVDCITELYRQFSKNRTSLTGRILSRVEAVKTARYESWLLSRFDGAIVTSQRDRDSLLRIAAERNSDIPEIRTISIGVDSAFFRPDNGRVKSASIVFSGKMGYTANALAARHFADDIFPLIQKKKPEAKFFIVGANPPKDIRKLARRGGIEVTGRVEDIRPFLSEAEVVVCPLRVAVGIQYKILEAMAMAKPVVAYHEVVCPLASPPEPPVLTASDPSEFAEKVCRLFEDGSLRRSLQSRARDYIDRFYDWGEKTEELEQFYKDIIDASPSDLNTS